MRRPAHSAESDRRRSLSALMSWPLRPMRKRCMDGTILSLWLFRVRSVARIIFARLACAVLVVTYVKNLTLTIVFSVASSRRIHLMGEVHTQSDFQSSVRGRPKEVVLYWYLGRSRGAVAMRQLELPPQRAASQSVCRHFGSSAISATSRCAESDSVAKQR